jgi:adenosine deaminase
MFSLLHLHFESVVRTLAEASPGSLKQIQSVFTTPTYRAASPAQRLQLLERQIQQCAQCHRGIFTETIFTRIVHTFFQELERSQVSHVDLRIGVSTRKWPWMKTIADGIQVFERERKRHFPAITLSFLAAVNFAKPIEEIEEIFDILSTNAFVQQTFVGVDINLVPADLSTFLQFVPSLHAVQQKGWKINLHLGELFENAFSQEVLSSVIPQRIGHGVRLLEDEHLVKYIQHHDICLDMGPISNTRLGVWDWW